MAPEFPTTQQVIQQTDDPAAMAASVVHLNFLIGTSAFVQKTAPARLPAAGSCSACAANSGWLGLGWLACLVVGVFWPVLTQAQAQTARSDERWVIVPVLSAPLPRDVDAASLTRAFEVELRATGQSVLPSDDAASLFETRHSAKPVKLSEDELTRASRSISQAERHLAFGEVTQAQQAIEPIHALSGPARDSLNRDPRRARSIFDVCTTTAYLLERQAQHAPALRQMLECARSFPGFRPDSRSSPPELREVFEHAQHQLGQEQSSTLVVQGKGGRGCLVRVNGLELGTAPFNMGDLHAGIARVQLECQGEPGRIHVVDARPGENRVEIEPGFDAAVRSHDALWLEYEDDDERTRRVDADLAALQRVLGVSRTVALFIDGSDRLRVRVHPLFPAPAAERTLSFSLGAGYRAPAVAETVAALRGGTSLQPTAADENPTGGASDEPPLQLQQQPSAAPKLELATGAGEQNVGTGVFFALLGTGALTAAWIQFAVHVHDSKLLFGNYVTLDAKKKDDLISGVVLGLAGGGSALFALSEYFWLPEDPAIPTWAWLMGGLGLAGAVTGIIFAAVMPHCEMQAIHGGVLDYNEHCTDVIGNNVFGPLLAIPSAPLLTLPIAYALRIAARPNRPQVAVGVTPLDSRGLGITLHGAF
jgi:hypothetical protein